MIYDLDVSFCGLNRLGPLAETSGTVGWVQWASQTSGLACIINVNRLQRIFFEDII